MPYHWVRLPSSPPDQRRSEVHEICRRHGARLCERQTYYDENGHMHVLVQLGAEDPDIDGLLTELRAIEAVGLVDADEQHEGVVPPPCFFSESGD